MLPESPFVTINAEIYDRLRTGTLFLETSSRPRIVASETPKLQRSFPFSVIFLCTYTSFYAVDNSKLFGLGGISSKES